MKKMLWLCAVAAMLLSVSAANAQLSQEQLDKVRKQRIAEEQKEGITYAGNSGPRSPTRHLHTTIIDPVSIDNAAARTAFSWWSNTTGIPLVINWRELENAGIDPETPIDLDLRNVPASIVLSLMMKQLSPDEPLMYEVTEWYIRIMTKEQASRETVTLIYDIQDLIARIPNFPGQEFDLNAALSNTSSGGSSGGGAQAATTLFGDTLDGEPEKTKEERGEEIAQIIRETIEPDQWQEFGGQHSSIRHFNGRLIIKAPRYIHAQIGIPATGSSAKSMKGRSYTMVKPVKATDIAGVRPAIEKIGGVQGK